MAKDGPQGAWILAAALIFMNGLLGFFSSRSRRLERLLEGCPVLIGRDSQWFPDVLSRHRLSLADAEKALREADCALRDLKLAILETDGSISIVKK